MSNPAPAPPKDPQAIIFVATDPQGKKIALTEGGWYHSRWERGHGVSQADIREVLEDPDVIVDVSADPILTDIVAGRHDAGIRVGKLVAQTASPSLDKNILYIKYRGLGENPFARAPPGTES